MLKDIRRNPLLLTDCYNLSHQRLKCNTDWEVSHMYNRREGMILYGLHETAMTILNTQITMEMVEEADEYAKMMGLIFPRELFERLVEECDGYLPLQVQTLPEGTWCPTGTPFMQNRNTVEGFGEIVTWFEGIFMHSYFPSSCATESFHMRRYLESKKEQYGYDDSFLWRLHSFGFRGHKSLEDAYWAGTAWNLFLHGTDDFHTVAHTPNAIIGSIPALAHKVTQQFDNEYDCFVHSIKASAKVGEKVVALVIDTYDAHRVINEYLIPLSEVAKAEGVHIVLRPDSGDTWQQVVDIYRIVSENGITNVTTIVGESMSFENVKKADEYFEANEVPLNFVFYGVGAGFYKTLERDTLGWAMKTAYSNGKPRMKVVKSNPFKQSIPNVVHLKYIDGLLTVCDGDGEGEYITIYEMTEFARHSKPVTIDSWRVTQARAMELIHIEDLQERIAISEETQALTTQIVEMYE